jgi:GNAT superfamily N-acetyltransferase
VIRPAIAGDAEALSRVHRAGRRAAYAGWGTEAQLDGPFDAAWWREVMATDAVAIVAEEDGEVAGLALVEGDLLGQLYVRPDRKGTGLGGQLFDAAVTAGARRLQVYEDNAPARAFYEHRGWTLVEGSATVEPQWAIPLPAVTYRRP